MSCHLTFFLIKSINCVEEFQIVILVVGEVQLYHEDEAGEGRLVYRSQTAVVKVDLLQIDHVVALEEIFRKRSQVIVTHYERLEIFGNLVNIERSGALTWILSGWEKLGSDEKEEP